MKINELRKKSESELQKLLVELRGKLRVLRFNLVAGKLKNVSQIRETKRDIARVLTLLREAKHKKQEINIKKK